MTPDSTGDYQSKLEWCLTLAERTIKTLEERLSEMDPMNPDHAGTDTMVRATLDQLRPSVTALRDPLRRG